MPQRSALIVFAACLGSLSTTAGGFDCRYSADRNAREPVAGVARIRIEAGAGALKVTGHPGASEVEVSGRACSDSQALLAATSVRVRREADVLVVSAELPDPVERRGLFGDTSDYASLDLKITVPDTLPLDIEDSSGDLELANVAATRLADSSGGITIHSVAGDLELTDSSGNIQIEDVRGNLRLSDSSGNMTIAQIAGDVIIPVDSSGDMDIRHVKGAVHIETDTSGDVTIMDVERDVTIDMDSSGSIRVARVGGSFTVGADASGNISYRDVQGALSLPRKD